MPRSPVGRWDGGFAGQDAFAAEQDDAVAAAVLGWCEAAVRTYTENYFKELE